MDQIGLFALVIAPFVILVFGGIVEFRRDRQSLRSPVRLVPLALAGVLSVSLPVTGIVPDPCSLLSSAALPVTMAVLSLFVAVSALTCRYRSRIAKALLVAGALILAVLWLANRCVA